MEEWWQMVCIIAGIDLLLINVSFIIVAILNLIKTKKIKKRIRN